MATTFGLGFALLSEESQLHGTNLAAGLSSASVGSNHSSTSSTSSSSSGSSGSSGASSATSGAQPSSGQSGPSTSLASGSGSTSSSVTTSASPQPLAPASPTSFKPTSYESHSRLIAGYPRLPGFYGSTYGASGEQSSLYPTTTNTTPFYPSLSSHYELEKTSNGNGWTPLSSQAYHSAAYDAHHSFYNPYGNCYGAIDSAARRKNATRETTNTLKAWLYEHRKNPYPTKGEKIMLAIITKMTLTQVSTWFANARRRLKKENKMTWEPKNKANDSRDDSDKDSCKDIDDDLSDKNDNGNGLRIKEEPPGPGDNGAAVTKGHLLSNHHQQQCAGQTAGQQPTHHHQHGPPPSAPSAPFGMPDGDNLDGQRPKIWSLAHTATSATDATSLAGRLYPPDWSAYSPFHTAHHHHQSAADNLLLTPLSAEHYHHHHSNHSSQHVQSSPSTNFYSRPGNACPGWPSVPEDSINGHQLDRRPPGNFACSPSVPFLSGNPTTVH